MWEIEKHFSKVAHKLGYKAGGERGYDPDTEFNSAILDETLGAKPLAHNLLYDSYDDVSGIAFSKGSLGCWFEISPIIGSNESIEKNLTLFFNEELAAGGHLQFMVIASNNITPVMNIWEAGRTTSEEWLNRLTVYRRHFIENTAKNYAKAGEGRLARHYRFFVTYSILDVGDEALSCIISFKQKLYNKLKTEGLNPVECKALDLIAVSRELLQMRNDVSEYSTTSYDPLNDISSQIVKFPFRSTVEADRIIHNDTDMSSKILYPSELPESFSLSEMIGLLGNEYKVIPARFVISYSIANNLGNAGTASILTKGDRSIHAASKSYTQNDILAQEEASEWLKVKAIHQKGEIFLSESMLIMITAPSTHIDIAQESLRSLYNSIDWKLNICSNVQRLCSLSILPMMQSSYWNSLKFFKLTRIALSGEVVAKLPIQGEWCGVPKSGALLIGRRGQLFNFNPFYRIGGGGNYNVCMMAPSGSGKSFFTARTNSKYASSEYSCICYGYRR